MDNAITFRTHIKQLIMPILFACIVIIIGGYLYIQIIDLHAFDTIKFKTFFDSSRILIGLFIILLSVILINKYTLMPWVKWLTYIYKIDSTAIQITYGLFKKRTETILISKVNKITTVQSSSDKLFNTGTITIYCIDDTVLTINAIPNFKHVDEVVNNYIRMQGVE